MRAVGVVIVIAIAIGAYGAWRDRPDPQWCATDYPHYQAAADQLQTYIDQQKAKGDWETYLRFQSDADHDRAMAKAVSEAKRGKGCP